MKNEYLDSINLFGKSAVESTKELVEINSRLMSKMLENQISVANLLIESSEKQISSAGGKTDPKDLLASQTALYEEYASKFAEAAQANAKLAQQAGEELKTWFEKGVKTADEAVKGVASSVATASQASSAPTKATSAPSATTSAAKTAPKKASAKKSPAKKAPARISR